jgi:hypothetical protein
MHISVAHPLVWNLQFPHCHQVVQVAFQGEVVAVHVEVQIFLRASRMSADSLLYHFGMEGSRLLDFPEPLWGDYLSQPLLLYMQETQLTA